MFARLEQAACLLHKECRWRKPDMFLCTCLYDLGGSRTYKQHICSRCLLLIPSLVTLIIFLLRSNMNIDQDSPSVDMDVNDLTQFPPCRERPPFRHAQPQQIRTTQYQRGSIPQHQGASSTWPQQASNNQKNNSSTIERCFHPGCSKQPVPFAGHTAFKCRHCTYRYCSDCVDTMFDRGVQLSQDASWPPICWNRTCRRAINVENVLELLSKATRAKIDRLLPERNAKMPLYCANIRCTDHGNTFLMDMQHLERRVMVDCRVCHTWTCSACRANMVDHDGDDIICRENDHLAVMDEAHETRGYKGKDRETNRAATVFNDVSGSQAEAEAEADSYRHYQVCPKCRTAVQKSEGCSHMDCPQCKTEFCFVCGAEDDQWNFCNCPAPNYGPCLRCGAEYDESGECRCPLNR